MPEGCDPHRTHQAIGRGSCRCWSGGAGGGWSPLSWTFRASGGPGRVRFGHRPARAHVGQRRGGVDHLRCRRTARVRRAGRLPVSAAGLGWGGADEPRPSPPLTRRPRWLAAETTYVCLRNRRQASAHGHRRRDVQRRWSRLRAPVPGAVFSSTSCTGTPPDGTATTGSARRTGSAVQPGFVAGPGAPAWRSVRSHPSPGCR